MNIDETDITVQVLFGRAMPAHEAFTFLSVNFPSAFKIFTERLNIDIESDILDFVQSWNTGDVGIWLRDCRETPINNLTEVIVGIELDTCLVDVFPDGDFSHVRHNLDLNRIFRLNAQLGGELRVFSAATEWG